MRETAQQASSILFVSHVSSCGGAELTLLDLLECLTPSRFAPHVALPAKGELSRRLEVLAVPFHTCPSLRRLHRSGPLQRRARELASLACGGAQLGRLLRRLRPAIVHANTTPAALYAFCAVGSPVIPLVWHVRDATPLGIHGRLLARRSARIIAPSRACAALLDGIAGRDDVAIVPNGVACDASRRFSSDLRSELAPNDGVLAAVIGQLAPWKGHALAIDAMRRLAGCRPPVHLALLGDDRFGDMPGALDGLRRRIDEAGVGDRVRILGHRDDIDTVLGSIDFLVHPAFPEPFGRVVVEALAAGRPVIAFAGEHGPAEILRDGQDGLLVSPRTPAALAQAILTLALQPELRRRMGEEGRERARSLFDRSAMARRIERLYASVLSDAAPPSGGGHH